jgi:hypothetical protein
MICSLNSPCIGRFAWVLCCAVGLFISAPSAKAALSFNNGNFTNCSNTSGGSTITACPTVAAGNGGFAFGDTPTGLGNYLQGWNMINANNLHCVVTSPSNDNNLCGTGWTGGSQNLQLYAIAPASPAGGNYVIMDADSVHDYNGTIYQTATGLTPGKTYVLTFYQAAGQQTNNQGSATDWWSVDVNGKLNAGGTAITGGTTFGSQTQNSIFWRDQSVLTTPDTPVWQQISYAFTATKASEIISFTSSSLMSNTTNGVPPYLFLDGVTLQLSPEPSSIFLTALGVIGLLMIRKRMVKRAAAAESIKAP